MLSAIVTFNLFTVFFILLLLSIPLVLVIFHLALVIPPFILVQLVFFSLFFSTSLILFLFRCLSFSFLILIISCPSFCSLSHLIIFMNSFISCNLLIRRKCSFIPYKSALIRGHESNRRNKRSAGMGLKRRLETKIRRFNSILLRQTPSFVSMPLRKTPVHSRSQSLLSFLLPPKHIPLREEQRRRGTDI